MPNPPSLSTPSAFPASSPSTRALHVRADGISHAYAGRPVLTDVSLVVTAGTPTGLIGENGSGKSTLLRILAGQETPDSGDVDVPVPVGLLAQDAPFPDTWTVADVLADALAHATALEHALDDAAAALAETPDDPAATARYDEALTRATLTDVWSAPARAEQILAGLDADLPRPRRLDAISGGQRGRLALTHLLIARPLTLLLDEPTNHLDDDGAAFLAILLAEHPGPVLTASHDRAFLDEATSAQIDLDPAASPLAGPGGGATAYTGTFTDYLQARLDARERWEQQFAQEQEELNRLREVARDSHDLGRFRADRAEVRMARKFFADRNSARVSRHVRDAERRLEVLEREQVRKPPAELHFRGMPAASSARGGGVLLAASGVAVDGRLVPVSLALSAGEKLLITGPNGCGKSTLLSVLVGALEPDAGSVQRPRGLRIGHLAQDAHLDPDATPRTILAAALGTEPDRDAPSPETFGLVHPRDLDRPLGVQSRGQVRRAELAAILASGPELLVLDEPTNHLALDVATRLERAIQDWGGTVVIASHDRWLRRRWDGEVLTLSQ